MIAQLKVTAIAAAFAFTAGTVAGGAGVRIYYRSVIAAGEAAAARIDAKAAGQLNDSANRTAAELAAKDAHNEDIARDILRDMAKRADDRCLLGDDGARRLRELQ